MLSYAVLTTVITQCASVHRHCMDAWLYSTSCKHLRFDDFPNGPTRIVDHNSFCFRARRHVRTSANPSSSSPAKFQFNNFRGLINATRIKAKRNKVLIPQMQDKRDNNKYGNAFFAQGRSYTFHKRRRTTSRTAAPHLNTR